MVMDLQMFGGNLNTDTFIIEFSLDIVLQCEHALLLHWVFRVGLILHHSMIVCEQNIDEYFMF